MADFVVGANRPGFHIAGVNWGRDLPEPESPTSATWSRAMPRPMAKGTLGIARGIEVGHVFALGRKYSEAMKCTVLDANGKARPPAMGCYGIGVSRIVAAAIEQNHDANGIRWPEAMAPWRVAVCVINPKNDPAVRAAAEALLRRTERRRLDVCRARRPRPAPPASMFADIELIGIPHRVVVSADGDAAWNAGTFEYRARVSHCRARDPAPADRPPARARRPKTRRRPDAGDLAGGRRCRCRGVGFVRCP
jgi:prolyl-tRNA synthetase